MRVAIAILYTTCVIALDAKSYRSSEFGWQPGADVARAFAKLLTNETLGAGDELVLEHRYRIWGSLQLPDRFTLSATKGAGFDVVDAVKPKTGKGLLQLGHQNRLRNLTITYLNTPPLRPTGEKQGVHFTRRLGIFARGKNDLRIEHCRLTGAINHHIKLIDCARPQIVGCHIAGGHWSVLLVGNVREPVFRRCLIERCQGDSIKTGTGGAKGVRGALVEECVFQDNLRDGIDTTGGWQDAMVRDCVFRRLREGLDIKAFYDRRVNVSPDMACSNIRIENCQFYDMPNGITLTTIDGGRRRGPGQELITAANIRDCAPHDIEIVNCVFGYTEVPLRPRRQGGYGVDNPGAGEHMRMLLLKDAHSIRYRDIRFLGDRINPVWIGSIGGSGNLSKSAAAALERTVSGNVLPESAPPVPAGVTATHFVCGPR